MDHWFEMDIITNGQVKELQMTAEGPAKPAGQEHSQAPSPNRPRRGMTAYESMLWPGGRVSYLFDGFVGKLY